MATTTKIHVTATDNELYIIATTPAGSSEIGHIVSGYNNPVEYAVIPQSVLPKGEYTLVLVGINWGSVQAFNVILTRDDGTETVYTAPPSTKVGANWTEAIDIKV